MNETKVSKRQQAILAILVKKPLSRDAISKQLHDTYPISKTTLYRELQLLEKLNLIEVQGEGKRTKYVSLENPLTRYIDINEYFQEGSKQRLDVQESFNFGVFKSLPDILNSRDITEAKKIIKSLSTQEKNIDPTIFKREIERFTVEFSWKSSRIEGNTYTLLETELLIKQMREAVGHPKYEAIMLLNHKYAVDYILAHRNDFKTLTINKLLTLHNLLTKNLNITPRIRSGVVAITGTNYIPLGNKRSIHNALERTMQAIQTSPFPLTKALIAHAMIAYIQPFADGNKRTARTIANAILLAYDLCPLSYRNLDELEYIQAIILFYEQNSLYHLKRIFLEQIQFSNKNYFKIK